MIIEVWSDVVCPWCYIGKRRLESALAEFPHEVEVVWRSFQLDPGAPAVPTETVAESLGRKYGGGPEAGARMIDNVEAVAAEEGLVYRLHHAQRANTSTPTGCCTSPSSRAARPSRERSRRRCWRRTSPTPATSPTTPSCGTSRWAPASTRSAWTRCWPPRSTSTEVYADIEQAQAYGASGVPFFVIDKKYGVSGAQPADTFRQVLDRAWSDAHPTLEVVGAGDACGPDGCPV